MNYLLETGWSAFFVNAGQFFLAIAILVIVHELGHFLPAKWFGCRVDKFSLFFSPWFSLWKKKVGETEYVLGWLPLGGFVSFAENDGSDSGKTKQTVGAREFSSKPAWQQLIIMTGGIVFNLILAAGLFVVILFVWGKEQLPVKNLKYGLAADSLAASIGLKDGDMITAVNNKPVVYWEDLRALTLHEKPILKVNRNGKDTVIKVPEGFLSKLNKSRMRGFLLPRWPVVIDSVTGKIEYTSGELKKDDRIVALNGRPVQLYHEFEKLKKQYRNQNITLTVLRSSETLTVGVKVHEDGTIGFSPGTYRKILGTEKTEFSFLKAVPAGFHYALDELGNYVTSIKLLFTSKEHKVSESLGGPVSMGKMFNGNWHWQRFWGLTAVFSIALALFNLFPVPVLDGGKVLFILYEIISGRKPGTRFMEYAQVAGFVLMLALLLFVLGLDIWRLFQ